MSGTGPAALLPIGRGDTLISGSGVRCPKTPTPGHLLLPGCSLPWGKVHENGEAIPPLRQPWADMNPGTAIVRIMGHLTTESPATLTALSMGFDMEEKAVLSPRKHFAFWEHCPVPSRVTYWSSCSEGQISASFTENALP